MLPGLSDLRFGGAAWKTATLLERRFRAQLFHREALRFDTRYSPPARKARGVVTLYLVLRGAVALDDGPASTGPVAFVLREDEREHRQLGTRSLQAWGSSWDGFEVQMLASDVAAPIGLAHGPLHLSARTWDALAAGAAALAPATSGDPVMPAVVTLLEALASDGAVTGDLVRSIVTEETPEVRRLAAGIGKIYAAHQASATLPDLRAATGLSLAQLGRELLSFTRTFGVFAQGWREGLRLLRLRAAVLWLSNPQLSPTEVSRIVGYRSAEAMARAFRDAEMPAPRVVAERVRCPPDGP
jgi:AraC-like DNA-binding protein